MRASYRTALTLWCCESCGHCESNRQIYDGDKDRIVEMPSHCPECGSADWGPE